MADKRPDHADVMQKFDNAISFDRDNRVEGEDDRQFRAGNQWPDDLRREREDVGSPCLTINRIPQFVRQVTNDARSNRPSIHVRPVDDESDVKTADVLEGLIRHIEDRSEATSTAYIPGIDNAATCGIGHWRVRTAYQDDDSFDQEITIEGISDAFAVVWDPLARHPARIDADYCFVIEDMRKADFEAKYPDAATADFSDEGVVNLDWYTNDTVRVAEYWCKEPVKKTLARMEDGKVVDITDLPVQTRKFLPIKETREVDSHKIVQYIVSGNEILEGPNGWAGSWIPIVPVVGEEIDVGGSVIRYGLVRFAKDPQRLYNYWRSAQAEQIALQPKAPFLVTPKQIAKFEDIWRHANSRKLPYLVYNPDSDAPSPQRAVPPQASAGMTQEAMISADEMKATTGVYDAALGNKSNETSGIAIQRRQNESDVSTLHFQDNLSLSIRHTGRIIVDLAPKIYDTERVIRRLNADGSQDYAKINSVVMTQEGPIILHDLSVGKYDVTVTTGPSYATKRMEAVDLMMQFIQSVPNSAQFVMDLLAKNMDMPGDIGNEIAERFRLLLQKTNPEMVKPDPNEPPPQPTQADQMNALMAKLEMRKKSAEATKAEADAREAQASAEESEMDAAQKGLQTAMMASGTPLDQAANIAIRNILMEIIASSAPQGAPGAAPEMPGQGSGMIPQPAMPQPMAQSGS